jgi:hypothetical protein
MKKLLSIFLICCSFCNQLSAQASKADPTDAEGWYSASLKLDLPKKWEGNFTYEARYYNNLKTYYGSYLSLSGTKSLNKIFKIGGEYRIAFFKDGITHRYTLSTEAGGKINKKLEVSGRLQFQNRVQDAYDPLVNTDKNLFWRVRAQAKYAFNKEFELYGSVEPIMEIGGYNFVDNWRNTIGLKYKGIKKTKLDLFYTNRPDYGKKTYNRLYHIVGFNLTYTLKVKDKGGKKAIKS